MHKLQTIQIPRLEFTDTTGAHVIAALADASRRFDPERTGITIVCAVPEYRDFGDYREKKVTFHLDAVPLMDALKYSVSVLGCTFRVEENRIVVFERVIVDKRSDFHVSE